MAALYESALTVTLSPLRVKVPPQRLPMVACGTLMTSVQVVAATLPVLLSLMFAQ
jgi:hypothetical protein